MRQVAYQVNMWITQQKQRIISASLFYFPHASPAFLWLPKIFFAVSFLKLSRSRTLVQGIRNGV